MTIRAFDGSLTDAKHLLNVERATFDECPYTAQQLQVMLTRGAQRAWLAVEEDEVAGFVVAFPVTSLAGVWWEIDLLAVHPDWEGLGLGRQLIRAAAAAGVSLAGRSPAQGEVLSGCVQVRAAVSTENGRSAGAFAAAGLQAAASACSLLIYRLEDPIVPLHPAPGLVVRKASSPEEVRPWLTHPPALPTGRRGPTLVLAEQNGRPAGYAELIDVQTILYRGTWIESLVAPSQTAREALVYYALMRAVAAERTEVSALVPAQNRPLQHSLLSAGFRSLGTYSWFSATLPLPDQPGRDGE